MALDCGKNLTEYFDATSFKLAETSMHNISEYFDVNITAPTYSKLNPCKHKNFNYKTPACEKMGHTMITNTIILHIKP